MNSDNKKSLIFIVVPLIIWGINFLYDDIFFSVSKDMASQYILYWIIKLIYLILIFASEGLIVWAYNGIKMKEKNVKACLVVFFIVIALYMFWFFVAYPGAWGWDGYTILEYTKVYAINYWTSLLTSIQYFLALMIFPSPISVIVLQIYLVAIAVTRIFYITCSLLGECGKKAYLIIVPFLLPVSIMYILSPVRAIMFAVLSILICFEFIYGWHNDEFTWIWLAYFSILISLVAFWRSEGCMFIILIPCFIIAKRKSMNIKKAIYFVVLSCVCLGFMKQVTISNYQYVITSLYYPIQQMVQSNEINYYGAEEDLKQIDKVFNVEVMENSYSDPAGGFAQNDFAYGKAGFEPENATIDDYHSMLKGFIGMVLNKPLLFIEVRLKTFLGSMKQNSFVVSWIKDYDKQVGSTFYPEGYLLFERYNIELQNKVLGILSFKFGEFYIKFLDDIVNNMLIPIVIIVCSFLVSIIKKRWDVTIINFCFISITCGTIIFEPLGQSMYYVHQYIFGYTILIYEILATIYGMKGKDK